MWICAEIESELQTKEKWAKKNTYRGNRALLIAAGKQYQHGYERHTRLANIASSV